MPCALRALQAARIAAGWSQDDLARASNQAVFVIAQAEAGGDLDERQAEMIAAALGVTRASLQESDFG